MAEVVEAGAALVGPQEVPLARGRVIGLPVTVARLETAVAEILRLAALRRPGVVAVANVHMLTTARRDADLRLLLEEAALVVSDGRPLLWSLRRRGFAEAGQVRGADLTWRLCEEARRAGLPVWFHGGDPALAGALAAVLRERLPGLPIAGIEAPPLLPDRPGTDPEVAARIRRSGARLVFVGLGCPKQELWMQAHAPLLDAVVIGVGQAFGIVAGHVAEAPRWMQRSGLEWLFRLAREPRRLWRRYLVGNTTFVLLELADRLRRRG